MCPKTRYLCGEIQPAKVETVPQCLHTNYSPISIFVQPRCSHPQTHHNYSLQNPRRLLQVKNWVLFAAGVALMGVIATLLDAV